MTTFVTFYRDGLQLHTSKLNGFRFVSLGTPTGTVGRATCFKSVTVNIGGNRERVVTEEDFDGPVSMKITTPGCNDQWFGLASVCSVSRETESV
ncbi:hypothetical protein [Neorhodopirellula pilleata]|uniref:Uncharacterized protein n=1 Tax=Neorhodopirellula pilleata TaxID=2714738 RepID=A0A5C5ZLD1_9BACT|nr:hypothetical protein [Neorhodopirellula pilleata]TWT88000.1 hypothetical protein Pla100_57300 [Neorhodopirellula pilleata]